MSTKKINVLFKGKEKVFEINLGENNTYESFLKKINEEFQRSDTYQLMAMNCSEQFAILNQENYLRILNEDIPEGLKLFMSEIVKAPEAIPPVTKTSNTIEKGEEDDEDFIIENTKIDDELNKMNMNKNEEEKNNNDIKEEEKKEVPNILKDDDEDNNNNKIVNNEGFMSVVLRGPSTSKQKSEDLNDLDNKINTFINQQSKQKEKNDSIKNQFILTSSLIEPEMFKEEKCSICNTPLQGVKYICCLCDNFTICEECELYHNHPCFKYKNKFISNMVETSEFIDKFYGFKLPYESTGYTKFFRKEYDLKIEPLSDLSFCLRPNKIIYIPLKILNYSKETINSSQFVIICKDQKNIYLSPNENDNYTIEAWGEYVLKIKCITPERTCPPEKIFIEIYSNEINIKSSRRLLYEYNIEVNFDSDDDRINAELKNDEEIFCFNKEHKKIGLNVLKSTNKEFKIKNIFRALFENNWDQQKAIKSLKKRKQ